VTVTRTDEGTENIDDGRINIVSCFQAIAVTATTIHSDATEKSQPCKQTEMMIMRMMMMMRVGLMMISVE
jgi:hypothetical protein